MPAIRRHAIPLIVALALTLAIPATVLGAVEGLKETSRTTYTLVPDENRVHVESILTLVNQKKPTTGRGPCKNNPRRTCRIRTTYFVTGWNATWIPAEAENLRVTGKGVTSEELGGDDSGTFHSFAFPKLNHKKKQTIKVSYDLPAGEPGSARPTRVTDGYARFCWTGETTDSGTTRAVLPPGWEAVTSMAPTTTKSGSKGTIIESRSRKSPFDFYACTDAFRTADQQRVYVLGPSEQVLTLDNWPGDPDWQEAMIDVIGVELEKIEELVGSPMPVPELTITQVARTNPYDQRADFRPAEARLFIDEDVLGLGVPNIALARTWFNSTTIAEPWLEQGLAMWAGLASDGSPCPDPGTFPGNGDPVLAEWAGRSGKPVTWDGDRLYYQTAAACIIVERLATAVGPELMATAVAATLAGTPKYGSRSIAPPRDPQPAEWRDFLDAIDELGLVPAGESDLGFAERLLTDYGIATQGELSGRASARQIYRESLAAMEGTQMPAYVNDLMEQWSFSEALLAVIEAGKTYRAITADSDLSPAEQAALLDAFESATSLAALQALTQTAGVGAA